MVKWSRVIFLSLSILLFSTKLFAAQGLYLKINSYLPNTSVVINQSQCVGGVNNVAINHTAYLEAQNDNGCLVQKSFLDLTLRQANQDIAHYTINISVNGSALTPSGIYRNNDKRIVATLYPHSGAVGTQDWIVLSLANKEDSWMGDLADVIGKKPINRVILPGSHDTGTYAISNQSQLAPDISDTLKFWLQFDPLKIQHLKNWAVTQNLNISEQLEMGIRYLDIRLCKLADGTLSTCHSVSGESMQNVVNQVAEFLQQPEHAKEIIFMDINHVAGLSNADIDQLTQTLTAAFSSKIASPLLLTPSNLLSHFWLQKKQVIIFFANDYAVATYPNLYWSENRINSPWGDKQDAQQLQTFLQTSLHSRDFTKMHVLQTQETPSDQSIINGFNIFSSNPDSLLKMTAGYKHTIEDWLYDPNQQALLAQNGNIIFEDFSNGIDLTELAKMAAKQ